MTSRLAALWRAHRAAVIALCTLTAAAAALTAAFIWPITDLIAAHDVGLVAGAHRAAQLQRAREAVRTQLLTLGAGLFAAGALVYTAQNFNLLRRNSEQADQWQRRTHELTEQGQVTDRYTRAIEQLGSNTVDVTIGGIYALERIAYDSPRDHPTVMEVLAACIREHSREPLPRPMPEADTPERATRPDVQAAMSVIGRRNTTHDRRRINLRGTNLPNADLRTANFSSADLQDANLAGATLTWVKLSDANLSGAHLEGADLALAVDDIGSVHSDLTGANLTGAFLDKADLTGADLYGASLIRATLRRTILTSARLTNADLTDADLTGADLTGADLTGALWPADAVVPAGWQRETDSGRLKQADPDSGGTATD